MPDKKYFTPKPEDLYVGYELEWLKDPAFEIWDTLILTSITLSAFLKQGIEKSHVRIPYLTPEALEKEGWEKDIGKYRFFKDDASIDLLEDHYVLICQNETVSFSGYCPSINEFRYICKLLNKE